MRKINCSIDKGDWPKHYWEAKLQELSLPPDTQRIFGEFQLRVVDGVSIEE